MSILVLLEEERNLYLKKVLPTILVGSLIWLMSEVLFSFIFANTPSFFDIGVFYILILVLNTLLIVVFFFLANRGNSFISVLMYFLFAFSSGILSVPILIISSDAVIYVHIFVTLAVSGTGIVMIAGVILKEKFFASGSVFQTFVIITLGGIITLVLIFILFAQTHWFVLLVSSIIYVYIVIIIAFYGSRVTSNYKEDYWTYVVFRILSFLLLTVIIIVIIALIIAMIFMGADSFDFSGGGGGGGSGGGSSKKKKKNKL